MSRSLLAVLLVVALLVCVSAQSQSSSSSSYVRPMSSSSSYVAPSSSTGLPSSSSSSSSSSSTGAGQSTGPTPVVGGNGSSSASASASSSSSSSSAFSLSSSAGLPANTYSIVFEVEFAVPITTANINATVSSIQQDIVYNLAMEAAQAGLTANGGLNASIASNVIVTSINGTAVAGAPAARRLLQTSTQSPVTFVLLGSLANSGLSPAALVQQFTNAAANGQLVAVYTNATIPQQTITAIVVAASSSSTGQGATGGASSAASASIALLFAAVASMALLL